LDGKWFLRAIHGRNADRSRGEMPRRSCNTRRARRATFAYRTEIEVPVLR